MGLKGQRTKASYLDWNEMLVLLQKLERDEEYKYLLLFAIGSYTALRYGDLSKLKWNDFIGTEKLTITEGKTNKERIIHINQHLSEIIERVHHKLGIVNYDELIFINRDKTKAINIQYVNKRLKHLAINYNLRIDPEEVSTHMFRKTLGRHVWEMNKHSEKSLILLGNLFNHSSLSITRAYLGIRQQEIGDIYLNL
ncbi:MAG: tyrosine-type recombinase/integrase [Bacteroidales bacterium]|nr:tyrosine-type recombinase/integrase [Bacteroidales bacterium]